MSSIRKIAKDAGVSIATVSRALNNDPGVNAKTREMVLAFANSAGYTATVGRRATANIGFIYTGEPTLSNPFDAAVLQGMARGVEECRFNIVLLNMKRDKNRDESYTQFFMRSGVRGVILRIMADSRDIVRRIAGEGFPHVVISERFDSPDVNCVDCDSKPHSIQAVEYLIELGHRRIGFATHVVADRDHIDRLEGYKEALARNELPFDERLVFRNAATLSGGASVMKMVMSMADPPTAIYLADWLLAAGALKAAHEMGVRIPEDISILGFDDMDMRHCVHPTLTAVCQVAERLGFEAASRLTRLIAGRADECFQVTAPTFFEVNESTGPPPNGARGRGKRSGASPTDIESE